MRKESANSMPPRRRRPPLAGATALPCRVANPRRRTAIRPARRRAHRALHGIGALLAWDGWPKLASLLTAVAAIAALWFTAQSLRATHDQIGLTEQGQLTDRFGKAVEQIGSDKLDVRLGGIYALERLAHDSRRDQPTIMEVLTAFIRTHAPASSCPRTPTLGSGPPADIDAALTVIGRRTTDYDSPNRLNLSGACLADAHLANVNLNRVDLTNAILTRATLYQVDLTNALLINANLHEAALPKAKLSFAFLNSADLSNANLATANLEGAIFNVTNLDGTNFNHANLRGAVFLRADLSHANTTDANLEGASPSYLDDHTSNGR